jgi:hypothetical protein
VKEFEKVGMSAFDSSPPSVFLSSFAKPFLIAFVTAMAALRAFKHVRVIGITGSIASGKSAFCRCLARHSASLRVIDADEIARSITAPGLRWIAKFSNSFLNFLMLLKFWQAGTPAFREIVSRSWGQQDVPGRSLVMSDGQLDRKALGVLIFDHPPSRRSLNKSASLASQRQTSASHTAVQGYALENWCQNIMGGCIQRAYGGARGCGYT